MKAAYDGLTGASDLPDGARPRVHETIDLLVALYDAWGKPAEAREWRNRPRP